MAKKRSARKKSRSKKTARRPAAKKGKTKVKKAAAKKRAAAPSLEAFARKMVRMSQDPNFGEAEIRALYNEDCTSEEATGQIDRGYAGLDQKGKRWAQMQTGATWKATHVWVGPSTVCVEWDAAVTLRDGRTVKLREVAVHEIKNGKIQKERFYYNPMVLAPSGAGAPPPRP